MRTLFPLLAATAALLAQESAKPQPQKDIRFYRIDFVVKELEEAKVLSARTHQAQITSEAGTSPVIIRSGGRVPYVTSTGPNASTTNYVDVGTNIDCRPVNDSNNQITMTISAEVTSVITGAEGQIPNSPVVLRQNRWSGLVSVPLSKPTILFYSDDPNSRRRMQLEATVTPIK